MFRSIKKKMKDRRGFNMIELMVVVVIVGILAAIAVPIYSKYAKNARVTEATGRLGDLLTAAKSYAIENEGTMGDPVGPTTAAWPSGCGATNFVGDCTPSQNFTYSLSGTPGGALTITADGINQMGGTPAVKVTLIITNPNTNGAISITGL
jgi:prepilin-type N-terminal cleavage/methylation domain-containing protein